MAYPSAVSVPNSSVPSGATSPEDQLVVAGKRAIGMALSGGGVRAVAFHAGALRRVAELGRLSEIEHVSSVSGGSQFLGLVLHFAGYQWPSNDQYVNEVLPKVRTLLTSSSLQSLALLRLIFVPANWKFMLSRANVVAQTMSSAWGIDKRMRDLPAKPVWSINGSCSESGRRFRFKAGEMGDYETGYAKASDFPIASALAMSAAFPGGIGPMTIDTGAYEWTKKAAWDDMTRSPHMPKFGKLHLYDGGVYDNLGLEPLFDIGKQELRKPEEREDPGPQIDYVFISDAGRAYGRIELPHPANPARLRRVADLAFDQVRALRIRCVMNFLQRNPRSGALLPIGFPVPMNAGQVPGGFMSSREIQEAATVPTTLRKLSHWEFDLIARHGYETAHWAADNLAAA